jgi:hypothetical protein
MEHIIMRRMIYNMSILNNMLKAFSNELDYNKEYYTKKEQEKQARGKYNMIDICDEIEINYNIIRNKMKKEK